MSNIIDELIGDDYYYYRLFYSQKLYALIKTSRYNSPEIVLINPFLGYAETFNYSYNFAGASCTGSTKVSNIIQLGTRDELTLALKIYTDLSSKIEEINESFN